MPPRKKQNGLSAGDHSIVIGGNVQGSNIVVGNNNTVGIQNVNLAASFQHIYHLVDNHPTLKADEKHDAKAELKEIQAVLEQPNPDESFLTRRFRNLKRMAPDIVDVAFETLKNPISGVATVIQKIAKKMAE
ncbi:MAG: hypothetical protein AB1649_13690 [Chloroflexota bacterium]